MTATRRSLLRGLPPLLGGIALYPVAAAHAASRKQIDHDANRALQTLFATHLKSRELSKRSKAVLIFPKIVKAGLVIGGQGGDGVLRVAGRSAGYYNIAAASFGLQAGVETFSYAMFFMTDSALK
jgi:lipid-binding SYLF domain-containing protein